MRLNTFTLALMAIGVIYFLLDRSGFLDRLIHKEGDKNNMHKVGNKNLVSEIEYDFTRTGFPPGTFVGLMFSQ